MCMCVVCAEEGRRRWEPSPLTCAPAAEALQVTLPPNPGSGPARMHFHSEIITKYVKNVGENKGSLDSLFKQ